MLDDIEQLGKGLGKKEDGIAAPVRASLKFDHAGIGYDTANAESYGDKWWTRTYDDAANGLDVKNEVMLLTSMDRNSKRVFMNLADLKYYVFLFIGRTSCN